MYDLMSDSCLSLSVFLSGGEDNRNPFTADEFVESFLQEKGKGGARNSFLQVFSYITR
jgi:hypothetical protein